MSREGTTRAVDLKRFARRLRPFIGRHKKLYAFATVFELLTLGSVLLYPQLLRLIIDEGIQAGSMERVNQLIVVMGAVLAVQAGATFMRSYLFEIAAQRVSMAIRRWLSSSAAGTPSTAALAVRLRDRGAAPSRSSSRLSTRGP